MEELLNLFIELFYRFKYSAAVNKAKPFSRYAEEAIKNLDDDIQMKIFNRIKEPNWKDCSNGQSPKYLLLRGEKQFEVFILDENYEFIRRLLPIINDLGISSALIQL